MTQTWNDWVWLDRFYKVAMLVLTAGRLMIDWWYR